MVKIYSLWIEKTGKGKYKFRQRYVDPLRSTSDHIVTRTVSVTLTKKTAQAKREAEAILTKKIQKRLADGSKGSDISLLELTNRYQKWLKDTDRPWGTRERALGNLEAWNNHFEGAVAKNITAPMINDYLEYLLYKRKPTLSNSSVKLRKVFLSNAYEYGINHGLVSSNPTRKVKIRYKDESNRKRERIENKFFTDTELRALLGYIKNVAGRMDYYYLFKFCYETGMRISEASGLMKDDIYQNEVGDWIADVNGNHEYHCGKLYHMEEEGQKRNYKSSRAKTPAGMRQVVLSQSALDICMINKKLHPYTNYLFIDEKSKKPWFRSVINHYLRRVGRRLGIAKHISSHFFRHTYISKQTEIGTPLNVIMREVGQTDSAITTDIYTHVTENEQKQLKANLNKLDNDIQV